MCVQANITKDTQEISFCRLMSFLLTTKMYSYTSMCEPVSMSKCVDDCVLGFP